MKTEAAVLYGQQDVRVEEVTLPELRPGQVLVEMAYSGVCHSQLLEVEGKRGKDPYLPHTLGHEGSGRVLEVGKGVTKVRAGDLVILTWMKGRGAEVPSTVYQGKLQPVHSGAISTFMRRTLVSENRVVPIAKNVPLLEAALFGCMIPTGAGIVFNTAKMKAGSSVAVFGVGGIGLSSVLAAKMAGADPILAVDLSERKLELAMSVGATHTLNASKGYTISALRDLLGKEGVDFAIEAAGKRDTMEQAFEATRPNGGLCILAGNLAYGERITIDPFDLIRGKRIVGTWGGETNPDLDIPKYLEWFRSDRDKVNLLATHQFPLHEVRKALDSFKSGEVGRAMLRLSS